MHVGITLNLHCCLNQKSAFATPLLSAASFLALFGFCAGIEIFEKHSIATLQAKLLTTHNLSCTAMSM